MFIILNSILCYVHAYWLIGPPQFHWSNFTLQLYTPDKRKCPQIDKHRDILFHLYTRDNPNSSHIIIPNDQESLKLSGIDFSLKTIIFFHGFMESYLSDDAQSVKNAYLQQGDYNVILAQNERLLAGPDYITAARNCKPIARYSASLIDYLVSKGLVLELLHVTGLSLGGQIAGMTGQFVTSGKLPRITAFDPAGPFFNRKPIDERLDSGDGKFVDVIFTNSGLFGMKYPVGHLNFWPNGGKKQKGCSPREVLKNHGPAVNWILFCNHYRSYQLYVESIREPKLFPSRNCTGYSEFKSGLCDHSDVAYMGVFNNAGKSGNYYLDTGYTGVLNG